MCCRSQPQNDKDQLPGRPDGQNPSERRSAGPVNCIRWLDDYRAEVL